MTGFVYPTSFGSPSAVLTLLPRALRPTTSFRAVNKPPVVGEFAIPALNLAANGVVVGVVDSWAIALALAARFEGVLRYPGVGIGVDVA